MPSQQPAAGMRRRKISIQQRGAKIADGMGGYTYAWQEVLATFAAFRQLSAFELFAQGQLTSRQTCEYTIRYAASLAIKPGMRLVDGSRTLTITTVTDRDERHVDYILGAREP